MRTHHFLLACPYLTPRRRFHPAAVAMDTGMRTFTLDIGAELPFADVRHDPSTSVVTGYVLSLSTSSRVALQCVCECLSV